VKKIRIQRVSAFDIIITLALAVVFVALSLRGTGELTQMQRATDDYIQCETLARQLQSGSDYLVEQVRMYTATGQREYMDNYFEELNTTRRRETALEYFAENYSDTEAFTLLKSAMSTSQYLSYTGRYAMRLTAQATLADTADWPAEIQAVSLHDSDLTMSDADKMRKAQQLVSNSQYQNMREDVTNNISESLAALIELTRSRQNRAEQIFTDVYRKIELCAAVLVALMLEICIITRHLVPNCMSVIFISTALQIPNAIFTESFLSYLGLGVNAPMPSLGSLASDALNGLTSYPYRMVIPALVISLIVLSLNLFGDGLRDAFDPKLNG